MSFSFNKIISASLSPNTDSDDVWLALRTIVQPWLWKRGEAIQDIERWFSTRYTSTVVTSFNSGRSALFAILRAFGIGKGDEVLLQAFTCVAVPNSVKWTGATPIFVDIDETLNIDVSDAEKKRTRKTKALIVQHTFGIPANMDKIVAFCRKHKLILIEDCAHSLGSMYKGKGIGSFGDAAFFSFGRDKVVSSVWGGVAIISQKYKVQRQKLKEIEKNLQYPSLFWIFQQLLHPIAFSIILASYNWAPISGRLGSRRETETITLGKVLLYLLQKLNLLSKPVYPEELTSGRPRIFPAKFPHALAVLLIYQLHKLERMNENRQTIAKIYRNKMKNNRNISLIQDVVGAVYLRFPIFLDNPLEYIRKAKTKGILLGNWYHHIIDPIGVEYRTIGYTRGSCPKAEHMAFTILNLPTRITSHEAERVSNVFL